MKNPKISIIIPCYNAENFIESTINSVKNQNYKNWECIIINDGSKDKSQIIIEKNILNDINFVLINQENKGLSNTRNLGIEKSNGDYIFFLDADDKITTDCLEVLANELKLEDWDIVVGKTATIENKKRVSTLSHPKEGNWEIKDNNLNALKKTIELYLTPVAQNRLYKKSFLMKNKLKFKSSLLHEDELWFFETNFFAKKIKYINKITYEYLTDNLNSITNKENDKNLNDMTTMIFKIYHYYNSCNEHYKKNIVGYYILYLIKNTFEKIIKFEYKFEFDTIKEILKKFKELEIEVSKSNFSNLNFNYFKMINKMKNMEFKDIKIYFFNNPVNSFRKKYKLIIFNFSTK